MKIFSTSLVFFTFASFFTSANTVYGDVLLTEIQPKAGETLWSQTNKFTPLYPVELASNGIAGCAVFNVDIDENGKTRRMELVSSVPAKVVVKPAKKMIKSLKWHNTTTKADAAEQKLLRLDFCLGGKDVNEAAARCKYQSSLQCGEDAN
ncbi:energy transducer TonB [Rheinheimera mangrovi]|uniref:energy transducer TonB n=1 Tax=Rheinheimera mangrovi TaxID=2498451 RepID=UPI000F8E8D87|nr:energy transducer TonB [Rheinheimera mangrovi]